MSDTTETTPKQYATFTIGRMLNLSPCHDEAVPAGRLLGADLHIDTVEELLELLRRPGSVRRLSLGWVVSELSANASSEILHLPELHMAHGDLFLEELEDAIDGTRLVAAMGGSRCCDDFTCGNNIRINFDNLLRVINSLHDGPAHDQIDLATFQAEHEDIIADHAPAVLHQVLTLWTLMWEQYHMQDDEWREHDTARWLADTAGMTSDAVEARHPYDTYFIDLPEQAARVRTLPR